MEMLYANIRNELDKILLRKRNQFYLALSILLPLAGAALFVFFQNKLGIFAVNSGSYPILMLDMFITVLWPLIIFSLEADQFSGEMGERTLKLTLLRPISRFKIFLSKILATLCFVAISLVLLWLTTSISGLFLTGTSNTMSSLLQALLAYIVSLVPMAFIAVLAAFIAQFFKGTSGALITCIFVYLTGKVLPYLISGLSRVNPLSYTDWYMLWLGGGAGVGRLLNTFAIMLSSSAIMFALGYFFFDRKEL